MCMNVFFENYFIDIKDSLLFLNKSIYFYNIDFLQFLITDGILEKNRLNFFKFLKLILNEHRLDYFKNLNNLIYVDVEEEANLKIKKLLQLQKKLNAGNNSSLYSMVYDIYEKINVERHDLISNLKNFSLVHLPLNKSTNLFEVKYFNNWKEDYWRYLPVDLKNFDSSGTILNSNIYYDCFKNDVSLQNPFASERWLMINNRYYLHTKQLTRGCHTDPWVDYYPKFDNYFSLNNKPKEEAITSTNLIIETSKTIFLSLLKSQLPPQLHNFVDSFSINSCYNSIVNFKNFFFKTELQNKLIIKDNFLIENLDFTGTEVWNNRYFYPKDIYDLDFSSKQFGFIQELDQFKNEFVVNKIFWDVKKPGIFFTYKTDSILHIYVIPHLIIYWYDFFLSNQFGVMAKYLIPKDLLLWRISDVDIFYKVTPIWRTYADLDLTRNGHWVFTPKIVDGKIQYSVKWEKIHHGFDSLVKPPENEIKKFLHFDWIFTNLQNMKTPFQLYNDKIVSDFIDQLERNRNANNPVAERYVHPNVTRYRTPRVWRHFPHHAEYVEKYFTDPSKKK